MSRRKLVKSSKLYLTRVTLGIIIRDTTKNIVGIVGFIVNID